MSSECDGCSSQSNWILHNIRHRGIFHRLCTSCVLKFNPDSFCCVCYQVFNRSDTIPCSKCPSQAHLHCVSIPDDKHSPNPYTCRPCLDRDFSLFDHAADEKARLVVDVKLAKMLVAASWIASVSMRKAATAKRMDAECRLKDAAFAKQAAMESLELLASTILSKTKGVTDEVEIVRVPDPVNPPVEQQTKKNKKNKKKKKSITSVSGGGPNPVKLAIANQKKKKKKKKKKSKTIDAAAQNEIYKKFYTGGNSKTRYTKGPSSKENVTTVSDNLPKVVHTDPNNVAFLKDGDRWKLQNCALVNENKCGDLNNSQGHIVKEEAKNNSSLSTLTYTGHPQQHPHNSHGVT